MYYRNVLVGEQLSYNLDWPECKYKHEELMTNAGSVSYSPSFLIQAFWLICSSIMFLAKKLVGGLLEVVSNIDQFVPSDPPPPRRPQVYAEQNESAEERQFRKVFQQLAGDDMEVSPNELMDILNRILKNHHDLKTDGFSIDTCRGMVAVMDSDSSGKLGFHEFKHLWNNIKKWQGIYKTFDADHSGMIGADELPGAFRAAGFPLSDQMFKMITCRYSEDGNMDFDNYISCLVRLDAMCRAFKALDKDNNGSVKINLCEWLQLTMLGCCGYITLVSNHGSKCTQGPIKPAD
ncbi:calpain small subunit 1-like [Arapaima gigas]